MGFYCVATYIMAAWQNLEAPYRRKPLVGVVLVTLVFEVSLCKAAKSETREPRLKQNEKDLRVKRRILLRSAPRSSSNWITAIIAKESHPFLLVEGRFVLRVEGVVGLAPNNHDPPSLTIHTLQQKNREQPVPRVVGRKRRVKAILGPRLRRELEIARIQHKRSNGRDLARCHARIDGSSRGAHAGEARELDRQDVVGVRLGESSGLKGRREGGRVVCVSHVVDAVVGGGLWAGHNAGDERAAETAVCASHEDCSLAAAVVVCEAAHGASAGWCIARMQRGRRGESQARKFNTVEQADRPALFET